MSEVQVPPEGGPGETHNPRLTAHGVTKSYGGTLALAGVDLRVAAGQVLAVVGENGAGKSTLMKVLAGHLVPEAGHVEVDGVRLRLGDTRHAAALGVLLIHQELALAPSLDVAQNLFLGRELILHGTLNHGAMHARATEVLEQLGTTFGSRARVGALQPGQRQQVEIARALAMDARVLVFDEPTSSLSSGEAERLFGLIEELKARGVSVLYITHRLPEVLRLADHALVLRDGHAVRSLDAAELSRESLVRAMVGRAQGTRPRVTFKSGARERVTLKSGARERVTLKSGTRPRVTKQSGTRERAAESEESEQVLSASGLLEVRAVHTSAWPEHGVDLSVHAGERVALAGLVGAGRTELLETLFGLRPCLGGQVLVGGKPLTLQRPAAAVDLGLALVPEDRAHHGLFQERSTADNLATPSLGRLGRLWKHGRLRRRDLEAALAARQSTAGDVRAADLSGPVAQLSGGNQQKVVLGKWLATEPLVLMLDEPTRGVDVGARAALWERITSLGENGLGVLFASSDLEEVLTFATRIVVMHEGRIAGELAAAQATEETVMRLATAPCAPANTSSSSPWRHVHPAQ